MLNDDSIVKLVDYVNAKDCFPNSSIGGGVCYFLIDRDYHGLCTVTNVSNNSESSSLRSLSDHGVFIRFNKAVSILNKIILHNEKTVDSLVLSRNPFGLPTSFRGTEDVNDDTDLIVKTSDGLKHCSMNDVTQGKEYIDKYKVFLSRSIAEHAGEPNKDGTFTVVSSCGILKPFEICSDSYLILFVTEKQDEAESYFKYLKTKFYRFLLLLSITSISLSRDKFQFIPIQDFSHPYSDDDLNLKYGLSDEEISFIDSLIKEKVRS